MRKLGFTKKIVAATLTTVMAMGMLTGCTDKQTYTQEEVSTTKALVIGDYDIYLDELIVYCIQDIYLQGGDSATFDDVSEDYRKMTILSTLRENKIIYDVATNNNLEINESDQTFIDQSIANFKIKIGDDILNKYGISDELLERLFYEQACVTKFENDMKNDMGQTIKEDLTNTYADTKFSTMYYMTFPTVKVGEDDLPVTDDTGAYVYVSDTEKEQVKKNAEAAVERIRAGEDYMSISEEYGITAYSSETNGYSGSYGDEMNDVIDALGDGDCSDPIESTLGYNVIVMISADDTELKESYIYNLTNEAVESEFENLRNMWLGTIEIDANGDLEGTVWADFDLKQLLIDMEEAGLTE